MKNLSALVLLVLFVVSCSKDSGSTNNGNTLLKRIESTYSNPNSEPYIITYAYNGNKLLTINDNFTNNKFFYTNDFITRIESYIGNQEIPDIITYDYNSLGQLTKYTTISENIDRGFIILYTYNDDGTITLNQYIGDASAQEQFDYSSKYFMTSNNEIHYIEEYKNSGTQTTTFTYDNKNNPFRNIQGFSKLQFSRAAAGYNFNVTSMITSNEDEIDRISSYEYSNNDYPTIETITETSSFITSTNIRHYFYE